MDTITLIRSAIRGLLRVAEDELETELRARLTSGDDYATTAKPQIDWDAAEAREALIDSRAKDARACLALLDGRELNDELTSAARLLAEVVGQDLEEGDDGTFRIARKVAKDRIISTVAAPRGALTYPPWSGEGSEVISLGPMADLDSKDEGDNSMPLN
jgi:hypothetical protein